MLFKQNLSYDLGIIIIMVLEIRKKDIRGNEKEMEFMF